MKILDVKNMQELDHRAITELSIPQEILMENASLSAAALIDNIIEDHKSFLVLAGPGNNGGDGLALARKLHSKGYDVKVVLIYGSDSYKGASRSNYNIVTKYPIDIFHINDIDFMDILNSSDFIIDSIFGVGLDRDLDDHANGIIELINSSNKKILSLDIPSGINGNNGIKMRNAIRADYTISFGYPKIGNLAADGKLHSGKLFNSSISFPKYFENYISGELNLPNRLNKRDEASHKGTYGGALFVAGGSQYYGAPYFNSFGYLKSGGTYSRLACPAHIISTIANKAPEVVFHPMATTRMGNLNIENLNDLIKLSETMDIIAIGAGTSLEEESKRLIAILTQKINKPIIIDGDGITAISERLDLLSERKAPTILTPHYKELSFLMKKSIDEIKWNQNEICTEFSKRFNSILVVKGPHTSIYLPNGSFFINPTGNEALATAGSGDLLTGVVAACYGKNKDLVEAVKTGVFIHGYAGDLIKTEIGTEGVSATDILNYLPKAVNKFCCDYYKVIEKYKIHQY